MSKRLNIGLVLPALPGYSETFIKNKINGLIQFGFKVSLFVAGKVNPNETPESVTVYYQVDIRNKFHLFFTLITTLILHPIRCFRFLQLESVCRKKWIITIKNLIINCHILGRSLDWLHFGFTTIGLGRENLAKAMGAKSAVSFRGFDIGLYPHQNPGCYQLLWDKIYKVHTISDDLYQKAVKLGLDPQTPFKKITPAINTKLFKSDSFNDLHKPLRILTVGRLHWKKGYEYALKALNLIKNKQINFEYHIVGDGNYMEAIVYAIHQLQLNENVKLIGQIPPDAVINEMRWADIYLQSSIQEGFCNAVLEAQAMGLLCIVTDAEGLSENVLDGETGWVVPKRSPTKIAEKIYYILKQNKKCLDKIRFSAEYRVKQKFDLELQKKLFMEFYN